MEDEEFYLRATNEVESDQKNQALWAKVLTLTDGDFEKAKYQYIKLRVPQLTKESKFAKSAFLNFVYDYDANVQINKVYKFVSEGKNDREIAEIFTKQKIINMERNNYIWLDEDIANIRRNFQLDTSTPLIITSPQQTEDMFDSNNFFSKLINGDFGLAKSFWVYGVLVFFLSNIIFNVAISNFGVSVGMVIGFMLVSTIYEITVILGVWCASNKYQGQRLWAILAKIVMVLWGIILPLMWLVVIGMLRNLYP